MIADQVFSFVVFVAAKVQELFGAIGLPAPQGLRPM